MNIMKTIETDVSERCCCTSKTRREAKSEPSEKDVAEPDQIVSVTAGTGQKNIALRVLIRNLVAVNIGEQNGISCTTPRWIRRLQRQIARLKERKKARTAKHPVICRREWS
jgi:hypothetical protein